MWAYVIALFLLPSTVLKLRLLIIVHGELRVVYPHDTTIEPLTPTLTRHTTILVTYGTDKLFPKHLLRAIDHSTVFPTVIAGNVQAFAVNDPLDLVIGYYDVSASYYVLG